MLDILREEARDDKLVALMDYADGFWGPNGTFPSKKWSVFLQSVRTNNDAEGYHNWLNRIANNTSLLFYILLGVFHEEAQMVPVQAQLLTHQKTLRLHRAAY